MKNSRSAPTSPRAYFKTIDLTRMGKGPNSTVEHVIDILNEIDSKSPVIKTNKHNHHNNNHHQQQHQQQPQVSSPPSRPKHNIFDFLDIHKALTPNISTHTLIAELNDQEEENISRLILKLNRLDKDKLIKKYVLTLEQSITSDCTLQHGKFTGAQLITQIIRVIMRPEIPKETDRKQAMQIAKILLSRNLVRHAIVKRLDIMDSEDELYEFTYRGKLSIQQTIPLTLKIKEDYFGQSQNVSYTSPRPQIPPENVTLPQILQNEKWRGMFKKYAATEYNQENIEFYEHAQQIRTTYHRLEAMLNSTEESNTFLVLYEEFKRQKITAYSLFLAPDALYCLNISNDLLTRIREEFKKEMEPDSLYCVIRDGPNFERVERAIEGCMNDTFIRFRDSKIWSTYVSSLSDVRKRR
jgi:hypothetical protein